MVMYPNSIRLFARPTVPPNDEEQQGVLLRYMPQQKPINYATEVIMFMNIVYNQATKVTTSSSETVSLYPADDKINLIKEQITDVKGPGSIRHSIVMSPRGATVKVLQIKSTGLSSIVGSRTNSLAETELFPEAKTKIGDKWGQTSRAEMTTGRFSKTQLNYTTTAQWSLSGFAMVRGHRCAVLEGILKGKNTRKTQQEQADYADEGRILKYFDYKRGIDIEFIYSNSSAPLINGSPGEIEIVSHTITKLIE